MFPSCGYFSSFPCPFFLNGLCERPYCHFRHSKHDIEKAKEEAPVSYTTDETNNSTTTTSSSSSPVTSTVNSTPASVVSVPQAGHTIDVDDVYFTSGSTEKELPPPPSLSQEQEASSFSIPSFADNSKYQVPIAEEPEQYLTASPEKTQENGSKYPLPDSGPPSLPTYLPTPKTPSLPAPEPVKDDLGVPVYQPTPKRDLKRKHGDQVKSKAKGKGTDLEYDPESNFSCAGLTNSSQEPQKEEEDGVDYQPTKKKGRGSGGRKTRLSLDSLMASPDAPGDGDSEDQEMPDGQFSDDELDQQQTVKKMEEDDDEERDEGSENFENIGDDDISSDEEFVEVPDFPGGDPLAKKKKNSAKSEGSKTSRTSLEKGSKSTSVTKKQSEQRRTSSDSLPKSLKSKSKASNSSKAAPDKSSKSSSHKRTTSSSSSSPSGKVVHSKENSKKSYSTSSSSGKVHSSDKNHQPSKHSSKDESGLSQQSEGAKLKHRSGSSSSRGASAEKHTSNKISAIQGTSSKSSSSSSSKQSSSKSDAERRSSSEGKGSVIRQSSSSPKGGKGSKESSSQKVLSAKHSSSVSKSSSEKHSSPGASGATHSHSDRKTSSSNRHSSTDSKNGEHRSRSKSSESSRKESSIKTSSKERSFNGAKSHSAEKPSKERSSSGQKLHRRNSASSTSSGHGKKQKADSSSHHKSDKALSKKSDSDPKNSSKLLERMNSNLFGESDSDNEGSGLPEPSSDEVEPIEFDEPTTAKEVEQEQEIDYSQFIHDSDFEDEDTFDECLRIFKEGAPQKKITGQTEKKLVKDMKAEGSSHGDASSFAPGKKRTAHKAAEQARKPGLQKKERPRHLLSPTEVMHNRIMEMQRRALERAAKQAVQEQEVSSTSGSSTASKPQSMNQGGEKKRVAHTPKPVAPPTVSKKKTSAAKPEGKVTLAVTVSKTEKRVAHTPNLTNLKRPVIPASFGSKVPSNIRQRYLNLIIDECLKFCANEEEAYKKALEEETGVYDRASNKNIYLRVAVNTITRLRAEAKESLPGSSNSKQRRPSLTQSHQATLGGSKAAKTSFTLHRSTGAGKKVEVPLTAAELYQKMEKYTLTKEQLEANGYPLPSPDTPGKAVMLGKRYQDKDALLKSNERTCTRCGKRFIVNADGSYAFSEECVYHWTRAYPRKKSGFIQHIYNCCNSDTSTQGCQVAANHVHEQNKLDELSGFMQTMPRSPPRDGNFGIYALDCEMVYTQGGLELARVTVVDVEGESVFESLVQPFHPIVDYNTRFSGITAADLKGVETTLTDVQAILLNRFSDKTILIGHSLESDLFALKLMHMTVVDTSVVFPHRLGPPYKRALKNLMLETFQKIIQCDDGGHDSKEDAVACLQLMKWRIKEDSKREQRYS